MARFYMKLHSPDRVLIEISEDVLDGIKPHLSELFGVPFLASEQRNGELLIYDFKPNDGDYDTAKEWLKRVYDSKIVKEIDIDFEIN